MNKEEIEAKFRFVVLRCFLFRSKNRICLFFFTKYIENVIYINKN